VIIEDVRTYVVAAVKLLEKNNIDNAEKALKHVNQLMDRQEEN